MAKLIEKYYRDMDGERRQSTYQVEFYSDERSPRRKRVSTGTRDRRAAEHKRLELERRFAMGLFDPWDAGPSDKPTVAKAVKLFMKRQKRLGRGEDTISHYEALLNRLKGSLPPGFLLIDVRCEHVERFLDRCEINASSTKNYVRHFRTFFRWAVKKGYTNKVPFSDDFREQINSLADDPLPSHYTLEQFEQLCAAADEYAKKAHVTRYANPTWVGDALRGLFLMGNRPKELETLTWANVDLDHGYVHFRKTKNRSQRRVYIPKCLQAYLREMQARRLTPSDTAELVFKTATGEPLTKQNRRNLARAVRRLAKKLKLPEDIKALYGLRHGFCTHHTMNGTPTAIVSGMVGHKRLAQMDTYSHYSPTAGAKWQEEAFGGDGENLAAQNARLREENKRLQARIAELEDQLTSAVV